MIAHLVISRAFCNISAGSLRFRAAPSIMDELQLFRSSANPVRPFELASMVVGDEVVSALEGSERSTSCDSSDP